MSRSNYHARFKFLSPMTRRKTRTTRKTAHWSRWLAAAVLMAVLVIAAGAAWLFAPLRLKAPVVDFTIDPGQSPREIATLVVAAGVQAPPRVLYEWFRWSGRSRFIRAGSYELTASDTPYSLLLKIVRGEESLRMVAFIDGWTFAQVRKALADAPDILHDSAGLTDAEIMQRLGRPGLHPEGRFYPDTYAYSKGTSDLRVLERALKLMDDRLAKAWEGRVAGVPVTSPEQALIVASLVEKETGKAEDRPLVAAVFYNRMRRGMPLQTDPSVIYGAGPDFSGNLTRADLQRDTPYNTYVRRGLPPTPIAMPSRAALWATLHPADSKALYFVARGDGSSQFSDNLTDHNQAVDAYIRKNRPTGTADSPGK